MFLPAFNLPLIIPRDSHWIPKHQISQKSIQWGGEGEQMDTTKLIGVFRDCANVPKRVPYLLSMPRRKKRGSRGTALFILKPALDGGEWPISHTFAFRRGPLNRRLCWPQNRSERSGKKSIAPSGNRITDPSGIQRNNVPLL